MAQPFVDQNNAGTGQEYSKIFKFAVCCDSFDPQRAGRIRAVPNKGKGYEGRVNDAITYLEKKDNAATRNYTPWERVTKAQLSKGMEDDPYLMVPFLPLHINVIPLAGEAIKYMTYESIKDNLNQEYIGPIISGPAQIRGDAAADGLMHTSQGSQNKEPMPYAPRSIDDGKFKGKPLEDQKGCFPNPEDISLVGRDNCDIVLGMKEKSLIYPDFETYDQYPQVLIRSGKLLPNSETPSRPSWNDRSTFVQINTFEQTMKGLMVPETNDIEVDKPLSVLIEYGFDIMALAGGAPYSGYIQASQMPIFDNAGNTFMAGKFTNETKTDLTAVNPPGLQLLCKYTFTNVPTIVELAQQMNAFIQDIDKEKWEKLKSNPYDTFTTKTTGEAWDYFTDGSKTPHPFYFRPDSTNLTYMTKGKATTAPAAWPTMRVDTIELKNLIEISGVDNKGWGLAFTNNDGSRDVTTREETTMVPSATTTPGQQGIVSVGSEKIYLLSYDSKELSPFILKTPYGIEQKIYAGLEDEKSTNSLVRGEKLLELLEEIVEFVTKHVHQPGESCCPMAEGGKTVKDLDTKMKKAKTEVLNKNIRIN